MGRVGGLILVAVGGLLFFLGLAGTVAVLVRPGAKGPLFVFAPLAVVGGGLLAAGVAVLKRTKPMGTTAAPGSGRFQPNVPVTGELNDGTFVTLYTPPVTGKHARPSVLRVSVPAAALPDFKVAAETRFDRVAKRVGLATEVDTGDETFDPLCYVTSDAVGFIAAYLADPVKRLGVLDLRQFGYTELEVKAGFLTAAWTGFDPMAHDRPDLEAETAARLTVLTQDLPDVPDPQTTGRGRRAWSWVLWLLAVGYGLTFLAGIPFTVMRAGELAAWVVGVLAALGPAFALLSAVLLRGTSSSHRAWAGLMTAGLFALPLGTIGTVRLLNATLDRSAAVEHEAVMTGKTTRKTKNRTNYYLQCRSWRADADTEEFDVTQFEYDRAVPGRAKVVVTTHAGWCGIEWVRGKRLELK